MIKLDAELKSLTLDAELKSLKLDAELKLDAKFLIN